MFGLFAKIDARDSVCFATCGFVDWIRPQIPVLAVFRAGYFKNIILRD